MLQSSRLRECRKFRSDDTMQRKCCRTSSLSCFTTGNSYSLLRNTNERVFISLNRVGLLVARKKGKDNKNDESEQNVDKADNDIVCNGGLRIGWFC